jgi:hypothetical protein
MIFGRGRAPRSLVPMPDTEQPVWHGGQVVAVPVALIGDPLADGECGYGVEFRRDDVHGALRIWAYAQYRGTDVGYIVALRVERMAGQQVDAISYDDPGWAEWFDYPAVAAVAAGNALALLVQGDASALAALHGEPALVEGWFAWDGSLPQ